MNKAFKTNQLHKIAKKKQLLADELIAEIKSGRVVFS